MQFPVVHIVIVVLPLSAFSFCNASWFSGICLERGLQDPYRRIACYQGYNRSKDAARENRVICNESMARWTEKKLKGSVFKILYEKDYRIRTEFACIQAVIVDRDNDIFPVTQEEVSYAYFTRLGKLPGIEKHTYVDFFLTTSASYRRYNKVKLGGIARFYLFGCLYGAKPILMAKPTDGDEPAETDVIQLKYCDYDYCSDKGDKRSAPPTRKRKFFGWPQPTGHMAGVYRGKIVNGPTIRPLNPTVWKTKYGHCFPPSDCLPPYGDNPNANYSGEEWSLDPTLGETWYTY